jgi:hypothetical protein
MKFSGSLRNIINSQLNTYIMPLRFPMMVNHSNLYGKAGKIPYKVKIFLGLMANGAVLTKDNLIRRN